MLLVGNTAAGMNPSYRFPGPAAYGSDTRSITPEVRGRREWLRATQGRDLRIVADRYSGLVFGSFGESVPGHRLGHLSHLRPVPDPARPAGRRRR